MGCAHSKLPPECHALMATDTHVVTEDDVPVVMIFRNLRTPHKRSNYLCAKTGGCLAISDQRILGYVREGCSLQRQVNVPFDGENREKARSVEFWVNDKGRLCVKSDLASLSQDCSGTMELQFQTSEAQTYLSRIQAAGLARAG